MDQLQEARPVVTADEYERLVAKLDRLRAENRSLRLRLHELGDRYLAALRRLRDEVRPEAE